ncbi:MAG: FlgD immunoglobulin-like domain containing protein, partial [bacterium]
FEEIASYLLSDHTLQIRSPENLFLTVMQIGDANTMGSQAAVEEISGAVFTGALLEKERLVIFSKDEKPLANFSYSLNSTKMVKHLLTELDKKREYTVKKAGVTIATGTTGANGTIAFSDNPGGAATYTVALGGKTAVDEQQGTLIPRALELKNYPNPFNPSTTITFNLPAPGKGTFAIYNAAGQLVRTLAAGTLASGSHSFVWDAADDNGACVASGVYLGRLEVDGLVSQVKLVLAK